MNALKEAAPVRSAQAAAGFLAFAADEATAAVIAETAAAMDLGHDVVVVGGLEDAIDSLATVPTPALLLVDLGAATDIMVAAERLSEVCDPGARVVLLGGVNDLRIYRELIAAGVAEYLVKPFDRDDLTLALERAMPAQPEPVKPISTPGPAAEADAVAVIGVRGGAGASTVAANVAWAAANRMAKRVNLIDMDLTFGTQALIMDVDPGGGLADAMREPGRMDELFVKRASIAVGERLRVMAAETDPAQGDLASALAFNGLTEFLLGECDLIVVDLPRALAVSQPSILSPFRRIVLVAEPTLAAMRDSARLAALIAQHNPEAEVAVVLNRTGISAKHELSQKSFEEGARLSVRATLPFDAKTAYAAEAEGKCILQGQARSKLGKALAAVADLIAGDADADAPKGLLGLVKRRKGD